MVILTDDLYNSFKLALVVEYIGKKSFLLQMMILSICFA